MKLSVSSAKVSKATNVLLDILIFVFGIILLISIYNTVQVKVLGNDYSSFFGYSIFEVQTGSMEPAISAHDWIIVKSKDSYELEDVVTFKQGESFITHRVIEKYSDTYITKGDANNKEDDGQINIEQIVGEVVSVIPLFGLFRVTLFNPVVLICLIATIYILSLNMKGNKGVKNMINKLKEFVLKYYNKFKKTENEDFFKDERKEKSFETIQTKPTLGDYVEKLEDYSNKEYDDEKTLEEKEEELSKTMFFRIISVDNEEEEKNIVKEEIEDPEIEEEYIPEFETEEDESLNPEPIIKEIMPEPVIQEEKPKMDEHFIISTDSYEDEPLEIEKEEEYEEVDDYEEEVEEIEENTESVEPEKIDKDEEAKFTLENVFQKPEHKKSKNIIARSMAIKEEEINAVIDTILGDTKMMVNEATIRKALIKSYVESRYYNIFSEKVAVLETKKTAAKKGKYLPDVKFDIINEKNGFEKSYKTRTRKILTRTSYALEEDSAKLSKLYSGNDRVYDKKVEKFANLIMVVAKLEYLIDLGIPMKNKKILYAKEIIKFISDYEIDNDNIEYTIKTIIKAQRTYRNASDFFLDRLNTEMFELIYHQFKTAKSKYLIDLKHNINFSQVYSEHVVDRAYQEGVVAEDKLNVLLTLLQGRLVSDMLTSNYANEYVVLLPSSLCQKEAKFERLFKANNEEYAKKNIIFLVPYDDFMKRSINIKNLRKNGFRIAMYISKDTKFASKSKLSIALAEYIVIDKQTRAMIEIEKVMLDNFKDRIIKEEIEYKLEVKGDEV